MSRKKPSTPVNKTVNPLETAPPGKADAQPVVAVAESSQSDELTQNTPKAGLLRSRRAKIIAAILVLLIIPAAAWGYFSFSRNHQPVAAVKTVKTATPTPVPTSKPSPLTGVELPIAQADRPVTGIVIENHPDARPQSGLGQAGVVYEALAEGGITRFFALFLENRPAQLGPVRSIRTYFVDWALEYNTPVAHVGGNADALDLIDPLHMKDINEFYNGKTFYRSKDRYAPHNAYTSSDLLDALEQTNDFAHPASFKPSPRTAKDTPTTSPAHGNIHIDYSYNGYQVDYKYDPASNSYLRSMAGAPHIDRNDGKQIAVKNVVVQYMPTSFGTTRIGEQTVIMGTPGTGRAIVFRDGQAIEGTWAKAQHTDRTKLLDGSGKDIPLNRGNTWYSIVPSSKTVSY